MELLLLEPTADTPHVLLDPTNAVFRFSGKSLPEDVDEFYLPLETWVKTYLKTPPKVITITFKMEYFNTASLKKILDILTIVKEMAGGKSVICIKWYYQSGDEGMREAGDEMQEIVEIPFELLESL